MYVLINRPIISSNVDYQIYFTGFFFFFDKATADETNVTLVMLSMRELQGKEKGHYTVISTLLSEYLVIQVQIKFTNCVAIVTGKEVLSSLLPNCIHVVHLV